MFIFIVYILRITFLLRCKSPAAVKKTLAAEAVHSVWENVVFKSLLLKLFLFVNLVIIVPAISRDFGGVPVMLVSDIKPGMQGIGKTVFYGETVEDFGFQVIDIVENYYPHQDIILVRLTGEKAEKNGVVSGMSGSPMYIDGKLIGALSMRFGQFMLEPIGGVMPIEQMLAIEDKESYRDQEYASASHLLPVFMQAALCGIDDQFWKRVATGSAHSLQTENQSLQNIMAPLVFSGFEQKNVAAYNDIFNQLGFITTAGGSSTVKSSKQELQPGSAVSQIYINGDFGIEATGTVTAVHNNKLLAFGHYINNTGPINLPLAKTSILATLPSMMGSNKMAVATDIIGSFRQDRLTGLYGDLEKQPSMAPVKVSFTSLANETRTFQFNMAQDKSVNNLMPLYLRIAMIQALTSGRLAGSFNSVYLNSDITLDDGRIVQVNDFFSTRQQFGFFDPGSDVNAASDLVAAALGALMVNDFDKPAISSIAVQTREIPGENVAKINSIWQDKEEMNPGDSLHLTIDLKTTTGKSLKVKKTFRAPAHLDASMLTIFICSGDALTNYEVQTNRSKFVPVSFNHILKILDERRKNNHLYMQVQVQDQGLMLEGEELAALPPSVMDIMNSTSSNGASNKTQTRIIHEESDAMDYVITGARRITVRIKQPQQSTIPMLDEQAGQPIFW
ncbi:MAG TPA: SpoIVB peptidase S55 domain-containing protein [bacterium]|nr:SpoIVB peptidase S55 domain-containing protein [bacterium]HPN44005.1 SpoIVB peptidase S55 domain-containing protein [bacterium]